MSAVTVTVTPCDSKGTWLITLHGDHDLATRTILELQTGGIWRFCKVAVIDLSETTFIDSGVIRWLLSVQRELEAANASTLSIAEGPPGCAAAERRLTDMASELFLLEPLQSHESVAS